MIGTTCRTTFDRSPTKQVKSSVTRGGTTHRDSVSHPYCHTFADDRPRTRPADHLWPCLPLLLSGYSGWLLAKLSRWSTVEEESWSFGRFFVARQKCRWRRIFESAFTIASPKLGTWTGQTSSTWRSPSKSRNHGHWNWRLFGALYRLRRGWDFAENSDSYSQPSSYT